MKLERKRENEREREKRHASSYESTSLDRYLSHTDAVAIATPRPGQVVKLSNPIVVDRITHMLREHMLVATHAANPLWTDLCQTQMLLLCNPTWTCPGPVSFALPGNRLAAGPVSFASAGEQAGAPPARGRRLTRQGLP
eukprot:2486045-Amphidinium_carterae.1